MASRYLEWQESSVPSRLRLLFILKVIVFEEDAAYDSVQIPVSPAPILTAASSKTYSLRPRHLRRFPNYFQP